MRSYRSKSVILQVELLAFSLLVLLEVEQQTTTLLCLPLVALHLVIVMTFDEVVADLNLIGELLLVMAFVAVAAGKRGRRGRVRDAAAGISSVPMLIVSMLLISPRLKDDRGEEEETCRCGIHVLLAYYTRE